MHTSPAGGSAAAGERGASTAAYGLLVLLIGFAIIGGTLLYGATLGDWFPGL